MRVRGSLGIKVKNLFDELVLHAANLLREASLLDKKIKIIYVIYDVFNF